MTDEALIARLRGWARDIQTGSTATWAMDQDLKGAADRIELLATTNEQLVATNEALIAESNRRLALARDEGVARVEQFERAEALEAKLSKTEGLLAECLERNALLEARLGKAVEALEEISEYDTGATAGLAYTAKHHLAEIKSHSDEFATQKGESHDAR